MGGILLGFDAGQRFAAGHTDIVETVIPYFASNSCFIP
jgi:hypothetical protein